MHVELTVCSVWLEFAVGWPGMDLLVACPAITLRTRTVYNSGVPRYVFSADTICPIDHNGYDAKK